MSQSNTGSTVRRAAKWLTESPDAATTAPALVTVPADWPGADTTIGRPRKSERRQARQQQFYAARRNQAATPRARFEVAVDQVRALGDDRALTAATAALDRLLDQFTP